MMKKIPLILMILFVLLTPDFLSLMAYEGVFNDWEFSEEQKVVVDYLQGKGELNGDFTEEEVSHLADVKDLMEKMRFYFCFLVLFFIFAFVYLYKKEKRYLSKALIYGGVLVLVVFLVLSIINFNVLFNLFHQVFFTPGSWVFPVGSELISLFSFKFFQEIAKLIVIRTIILGSLFILGGFLLRRGVR